MRSLNFKYLFQMGILSMALFAGKGAFAYEYPLDVHVHYRSPLLQSSPPIQEEFISQNYFQKAFLISTSYGVKNDADIALVRKIDLETSRIVTQHRERFFGLCGYNLNLKNSYRIQSNAHRREELLFKTKKSFHGD